MDELINQLITAGTGLGLLGGTYLVWLLTGVANNLFSTKKWSWKRMFEDVAKTALMCVAILAWVAVCYCTDWFATKMGVDISALLDGASIAGVIGGIIGGTVFYLGKAYKNIAAFVNSDHVEVVVENPDYKAVADKVKEFADSIVAKTDEFQLIDDGVTLDGEVVEDAGLGGLINTYPEPYRSAPKDSMIDPSTCYNRECVSYCAWKICETKGVWPVRTGSMSAKYWVDRLPSWSYQEVVAPRNGGKYVGVVTGGQYGHVVWFEFDSTISEYNYASLGNYNVREVNLGEYRWFEVEAPDTPAPTPTPTPTKTVKYTYKQGDTFGQVVCDLGLKTSHGLWGPDGDVAYYTEQLIVQGALDDNGNVIVGRTIELTPRKS